MHLFYFKAKNKELLPDNKRLFLEYLEKNEGKSLWAEFHRETGIRTDNQNRALHLYFTHLAHELNSAGLDMKKVLKPHVDISWTTESVKEYLWRPVQKAVTGKISTKELDKVSDINEIFDHLSRHLGEKFGIHVSFPHDPNKQK